MRDLSPFSAFCLPVRLQSDGWLIAVNSTQLWSFFILMDLWTRDRARQMDFKCELEMSFLVTV